MENPFFPAFGHKPSQILGREQAISDFLSGLDEKPGHRSRVTLVKGRKGMGKTALLGELATWAQAQGYEVLRLTADDDQHAAFIQRAQQGKVLVAVDDVRNTTSGLRALVAAYRQLAARDLDVALCLAGSPKAIEGLFEDSVLAYISHGRRINLQPLPLGKVQACLSRACTRAGVELTEEDLSRAAAATQGHPFMLQLVGQHLCWGEKIEDALVFARRDFSHDVLSPAIEGLSPKDIEFLQVMAQLDKPSVSTAELREALGVGDNYLQPYRSRLISAGVVTSPRRGQLAFALPCLGDMLSGRL